MFAHTTSCFLELCRLNFRWQDHRRPMGCAPASRRRFGVDSCRPQLPNDTHKKWGTQLSDLFQLLP
jgi:hypothetical protein